MHTRVGHRTYVVVAPGATRGAKRRVAGGTTVCGRGALGTVEARSHREARMQAAARWPAFGYRLAVCAAASGVSTARLIEALALDGRALLPGRRAG